MLRALCHRIRGNELIAAECYSLTGGQPNALGVADCLHLERLPQAAYTHTGLDCLAEAPDLNGLIAALAALELRTEGFRIEVLSLPGATAFSHSQATRLAADAILAQPNLHTPQHRFLLVAEPDRFWFGEILTRQTQDYARHNVKPYRTSSSLSAQMARALVNLAAPEAGSILDPFCGSGSILLEANACGLAAWGMDRNPKMVGFSRRNLRHYGYPDTVEHGDMLTCRQPAAALVSDLPYGRMLPGQHNDLTAVFAHALTLAPLAVFLSENDLSPLLAQAGYRQIESWKIRKNSGLTRFVQRARR
jgi:tRNA G10  N-methylase Trm11